jgi:predicted nuclease with TOPRIM domain
LKPDEKDKLAKFKEAYDNTLSESEKQAKNLENLNNEVNSLKNEIAEKDAIISALSQMTGKTSADVIKYIKMAKGLVDENTTIEQALSQVFTYTKAEKKTVPTSKPLNEPSVAKTEANPFKTDNLTEQGKLIKSDREKAREMYFAVYGKAPSW